MRILLFTLALPLCISVAVAQHQPYAGLTDRTLKALSEQQVDDLRNGRGMGLALAAELNGYPGPTHVLELGAELELTVDQRAEMDRLFAEMKAEAVPLGEELLAHERELDRLFAGKTVTQASLDQTTEAIGVAQGRLRAAHLKYHLLTVAVLRPEQTARYNELRGYAGDPASSGGHHSPGHGQH